MRRIRFYIIMFLFIVWSLILLTYFLVQTAFGAKIISEQLSKLSSYTISIGHVHHSPLNVYEFVLDDVIVSDNQQQIANISKLVIGLDKNDLWQLNHFNYVTVIDGTLNETKLENYNFSANFLKFINSTATISVNDGADKIKFQQANGGIKPFSLSNTEKYQFEFTLNKFQFNEFDINSVVIEGFHRDGVTTITNLGGNIENGFFISKLKILADKSWDIEQLKLNNIHYESHINNFWEAYATYLPTFTVHQLSIFESSLQLPSLLVEKGNLEAKNIYFNKEGYFDQSAVTFSADNVVWYDNLFSSVLLQLKLDENNIEIQKAIATWNKGNINFKGSWHNDVLKLDQLTLAGVIYQLPKPFEHFNLPEIFSRIEIGKLSVLPSMILNVDPNYPFTFTNCEGTGSNITIVKGKNLGLESGKLSFMAERGSVNSVEINHPDLVIDYDSDNHNSFNFNGLVNNGVLEIKANLNSTQTEFSSFVLKASNISSQLLTDLKLVKDVPEVTNYTAELYGKFAPFSLIGAIIFNNTNFGIKPDN